jgi:hypothetical protein
VSGRVIDSTTGQPPQNAQVSISPRDSTGGSLLDALVGLDPGQGNRYNTTTGEFVLPNVATGSYWVQVISQGAAPPPGANPTPQEALAVLNSMNTARMPVDVLGGNIDNLVLTVGPGMSIPGRVRVEGR